MFNIRNCANKLKKLYLWKRHDLTQWLEPVLINCVSFRNTIKNLPPFGSIPFELLVKTFVQRNTPAIPIYMAKHEREHFLSVLKDSGANKPWHQVTMFKIIWIFPILLPVSRMLALCQYWVQMTNYQFVAFNSVAKLSPLLLVWRSRRSASTASL